MSIPPKHRGEDPRRYLKRAMRRLHKGSQYRLSPLSRLWQEEESIEPVRQDAQRARAMAGLEPELPEPEPEREHFDEEALAARSQQFLGTVLVPLFAEAFGEEYAAALTDPDVVAHYLPFMGAEHPHLAVQRIAAGPVYDWVAACLDWMTGDMRNPPPTGEDLKQSMIDHAVDVMYAVANRPENERQSELAAAMEKVPFHERKTIVSRWREGRWEGEKPIWSTGFMRPDDPRFWELLHEEEQKREKWEKRKAEQARKRAKRKEYVVTKGPGGVVTAGPRRKRRKKPKRRK